MVALGLVIWYCILGRKGAPRTTTEFELRCSLGRILDWDHVTGAVFAPFNDVEPVVEILGGLGFRKKADAHPAQHLAPAYQREMQDGQLKKDRAAA